MDIVAHPLEGIPLFDEDIEADGDPEAVTSLKSAIREADALLVATPEYQHGVPGVLKNALEWAARPPGQAPLTGKPAAIMGATPGFTGTARSQEQLRRTLVSNACPMVMEPEVLVGHVAERLDEEGRVADEATLGCIRELLENLAELVESHQVA
jgi:chromate reductase